MVEKKISVEFDLSFHKTENTILCFQQAAGPGRQYFCVVSVPLMTDQLGVNGYFDPLIMEF